MGAGGGALTGAAIGSVAGPVGTLVGGLAGKEVAEDSNPTVGGAPVEHKVGTGVGAATGVMAGTAIAVGTLAGPVGILAGAAVGALAGGLVGQGVAQMVNPVDEDAFWRENYVRSPEYIQGYTYDDYAPAYRAGYEGYGCHKGSTFESSEPTLRSEWEQTKGASRLT